MPGWPDSPAGLGNLAAGVRDWGVDGDELEVTLDARQTGGHAVSVKDLLAALGLPDDARPLIRVLREAMILAPHTVAA
jgi:hypothetical protein